MQSLKIVFLYITTLMIISDSFCIDSPQKTKEIIILKLGGSLITKKDSNVAKINKKILKQIAREIHNALQNKQLKLIIIHGTGPFGHVPASKYVLPYLHNPSKLARGVTLTKLSLQDLTYSVVKELVAANINAIAFSPLSAGISSHNKIESFNIAALEKMLEAGLIPVLHGDCLLDLKGGLSIISSDTLAVYLAKELRASRVLMAMDHNGIFTDNPQLKTAKKIDVMTKDQLNLLENSKPVGTDVTGGIKKKVEELLTLPAHGIDAEIISGKQKGYLYHTLMGSKGLGTIIR